jgi:GT2 family glycosyltransferase
MPAMKLEVLPAASAGPRQTHAKAKPKAPAKAPLKAPLVAAPVVAPVADLVAPALVAPALAAPIAARLLAPALSIAICTYQRYDLLEGALRAAAAQAEGHGNYEILLIDNSPDPDRSLVEYRRHNATPRLRWLHEPRKGLSCARNRGVAEAAAPIIAFLDDDAVPGPTWLREMIDAFEMLGSDVMVIGGRVSPVWLGPRPAWLAESLLQYLSVTDLGEDLRILGDREWIVGANMALRRSAFDKVGLFPEHLGRKGNGATLLSNDETALLLNLRARGGLIGYAPAAAVGHLIDPARLSQSWFRRRLAWQAVSDYIEDPVQSAAQADKSWDWLTGFLVSLPPSQRSYRGLLAEMPSPQLLQSQLNAVYNAATCLLNGVELEDFDPHGPDAPGRG